MIYEHTHNKNSLLQILFHFPYLAKKKKKKNVKEYFSVGSFKLAGSFSGYEYACLDIFEVQLLALWKECITPRPKNILRSYKEWKQGKGGCEGNKLNDKLSLYSKLINLKWIRISKVDKQRVCFKDYYHGLWEWHCSLFHQQDWRLRRCMFLHGHE